MLQEISSKIEINGISVVETRATVMKDKGLGIFLKLLFGTGGIIILILALAVPMALPERIFTVSIGLIGLSFALSRVISLIAGVTRR
jgi:hypothetical protein